MKKTILIFISLILLCGCSQKKDINIKDIMENNEYIIIDVRTKEEYDKDHIIGAINIPYTEIKGEMDKEKTIFVYCQSGTRSQIAATKLKNLGYTVYDLGAFAQIDLPKE